MPDQVGTVRRAHINLETFNRSFPGVKAAFVCVRNAGPSQMSAAFAERERVSALFDELDSKRGAN